MMKQFEMNVGKLDRIVRIILGVVLLIVAAGYVTGIWMFIALLLGMVFLFTGLAGSCIVYSILGMSTAGKSSGGIPMQGESKQGGKRKKKM